MPLEYHVSGLIVPPIMFLLNSCSFSPFYRNKCLWQGSRPSLGAVINDVICRKKTYCMVWQDASSKKEVEVSAEHKANRGKVDLKLNLELIHPTWLFLQRVTINHRNWLFTVRKDFTGLWQICMEPDVNSAHPNGLPYRLLFLKASLLNKLNPDPTVVFCNIADVVRTLGSNVCKVQLQSVVHDVNFFSCIKL